MSISLASVLLVEDDSNDVLLMNRAFGKAGFAGPLKVVTDGERAIAALSGEGGAPGGPIPALVLLDLKLPRCSGFEVVAWIRAQPRLRALPVVVLTSSKDKRDVTRAYELGANAYLIKPAAFSELVELVKVLAAFWLVANHYPELAPAAPAPR
ncbi:MAG TPA: response regulator [Planctomycetota bacterium]